MGDGNAGVGRWAWTGPPLIILACIAWALGSFAGAVSAAEMPDGGAHHVQLGLHVVPFPGTPDASPSSEVIFSSLARVDLRSVKVRGSSSGPHDGQLSELPEHAGTAFAIERPFTPGERVTVTAALASPHAGTESGDPGARTLRWSFTVAVRSKTAAVARVRRATRHDSTLPVAHFHTRPDWRPPVVNAGQDPDHRSGDIFLTAQIGQFWAGKRIQGGPMILDSKGGLVWFRPLRDLKSANLEEQRYEGHPVLTWWQGQLPSDTGEDVIMSRSYRPVATLHGAEGYPLDLHDFQLAPRGSALVDSYSPVAANLTSVGGPRHGTVMDCVIQELDVRTGKLLWEWHALGHVPLTDSYIGPPGGSGVYDYFHLNSIQQLPGHRLLISARNTWTLYEIDQRTGRIIWRLGGKHSSFAMGPGTGFEGQHDARLKGRRLSLFDDADPPQEEPQSSAKLLTIDRVKMTVSLNARYAHTPPLLSDGAGSTQVLPNGDVFVGWGSQPNFSEYASDGRQIFDASFPRGMGSFRAYRFPWTGQPLTLPTVAVTHSQSGATVYASWNGATEVSSWVVLGGSSAGHLKPISRGRRTGFETAVGLRSVPRYVAAEALDSSGRVLGVSRATRTS